MKLAPSILAADFARFDGQVDAEIMPPPHPEHYQYDLNLRDIAEVWRRGSVIASWLLDLTAISLVEDRALSNFAGREADSGEGRWTISAAIDEALPAPVLSAALYQRFTSRGEADYQAKLLSAAPSVRRPSGEGCRSTGRLKGRL